MVKNFYADECDFNRIEVIKGDNNATHAEVMRAVIHYGLAAYDRRNKGDDKPPVKSESKPAVKRFVIPIQPEVEAYMSERGVSTAYDESHAFIDHFTSNGWKVGGKAPMKDWKASVRNWVKNKNKGGFNTPKPDRLATPDRTELFNEMGVGEAPFYNPLTIEG